MSHCTKFNFQYADKNLICKTFDSLGLRYTNTVVKTSGDIKWSVDEYSIPGGHARNALVAKSSGFNYFMEDFGNHYELSIEKHNMGSSDRDRTRLMEDEFRKEYIKLAAGQFVDHMLSNGMNAVLGETDEGFSISFGNSYEKSILLKFENGRVVEEVQGVKGQNCASLTEALENMLSSKDADLNTEWTDEYYETDSELYVYELAD